MELTLLDRYVIYSELLLIHESMSPSGICSSIGIFRTFDNMRPFSIYSLPEIVKRRPKISIRGYWFHPFDQPPRIKILKAAIREVVRKMNYDLEYGYTKDGKFIEDPLGKLLEDTL
jgi:hypothetical protein